LGESSSSSTLLVVNRLEEYARTAAIERETLGQEAFARAWAAGREMTLEQAIRCALGSNEA
jgi:hypothetical protein